MTPNFTNQELACKCGCGMLPELDFMWKVQALRERYKKKMTVSSAARCPAHNSRESSTGTTGPHTTGRSIDLVVSRGEAYQLLKLAMEAGFTGIGVQQKGNSRFLHLDDLPDAPGQPRPTVWSY